MNAMRFSDVFLRLGCALVAWMVLYAHFIWLAALGGIGCGPDGDELHKVLLALAAFMLAGTYQAFLISRSVYLTGLGICSTANAAAWHQFWGVAQMLAVIVSAAMIIRIWRESAAPN
jgi:hypothetical protein